MWQKYSFHDFRMITHYLGAIISLSGLAMLAPFAVALVFQEWSPAYRYLLSAGLALVVGGAMRLVRIVPGHMTRQQALAVTGFAWIFVAFVGAVPLFLSPHYMTYSDALFDAVSAFTTTDVSIISDLDHLSHADNMWRFVMNFSGGLGLVVVAISLGLFGGMTGSSLYSSEGRSEHVLPNIMQTSRFIFRFTVGVVLVVGTFIGVILLFHGFPLSNAFLHGVWLAASGFMTAGATPMSTGVAYYHSFGVEVVLMVLMIFGSINFALQSELWSGRSKFLYKDSEVRVGVLWWLIALAIFVFSMCSSQLSSALPMLMRNGLFSFISAATTTGFVTITSSQVAAVLPSGAVLLLTLVMAVGGSAGSTSGGIKLQRLAIIAKSAFETIKMSASAESVRIVTSYFHIGRRRLNAPEVRDAMTVFIVFITIYILGAMAGIACGYDALPAITESVAMASNSGITAGISQVGMPMFLKLFYIAEMWMGRLEYVTLIALAVKIFVSLKPNIKRKG